MWHLVVSMDVATRVDTSMIFCDQAGTALRFHGIGRAGARYGGFVRLYTDRGSHFFQTREAGSKVDSSN